MGKRGPDELLFQTSTGTAFTREKIGVIVRDASERAIGRRISPPQLRHAAAAAMLERTHGNLPVVSRALGHASTAVTAAVYGAVTDAAVGSALAKVALDFDAILDPDSASRFAAAQEHVPLVPDEDF
ncbi:INT_phiLC3_C multi-domain protein [Acidipropionibacterium acidipropionici ATCC 4875]|uniref:INT_phiLC3_C multi-domain protein n=1 Tax=Acidipropionibacterium acidipropionici (strain ATCC 4875 / DSM 20272 / JCM 6432 / NBRC 12425 / NCIMB 8070 / 4) TaxID=1171373 RepID=K7SL98_ACIA4|nr:INT_phiLC3_C multi-domain protein [Acidipropionibacterium acidipropionici ATCC 4875]